jgi:hypothetical protein
MSQEKGMVKSSTDGGLRCKDLQRAIVVFFSSWHFKMPLFSFIWPTEHAQAKH